MEGDFNSDIAQVELHFYYLKQKNDIYVRSNNQQIFILSDEDEKSLRRRSDVASIRIKEFVSKPVMGYSRIYNRKDIGKALEEAKRALETAKTMNMSSQNYDPLSVLQLLLTVKDTQEAPRLLQSLCGCHQTKGFRGKFKRDIDDHGVLCGPFRQLSGSRS